jgi:hypothetical protein
MERPANAGLSASRARPPNRPEVPTGYQTGASRRTRDETQGMTLFGPPLHDLKLEDIQAFLNDADAEPLLWEAKGTELRKDGVRKEVCGFANGHQTAYLVLGAVFDQSSRTWSLPGFAFPGDDPPAWVSSVVQQLQPEPRVDVEPIPLDDGHVAVVEVPPIAIPPCFHNGTVYERISGQTVPVKSPLRLSELYGRGEAAQARAENAAKHWAHELLHDESVGGHHEDPEGPRFTVAVNATGNPPDISSRLFTRRFEERQREIVSENLEAITSNAPFGPEYRQWQEQDNYWLEVDARIASQLSSYWHVRVVWDGTAVVRNQVPQGELPPPDQLFEYAIKPAWVTAAKLVDAIAGYGPTHVAFMVETGKKRQRRSGAEPERERYDLQRRMPQPEPDEPAFASVDRELRRAFGERVFEDED